MAEITIATPSSVEKNQIFAITPEQREALISPRRNLQDLDPSLFQSLRNNFAREGYVLVRGLLDKQMLDRVSSAGKALAGTPSFAKTFTSLEAGPVFKSEEKAFRDVSLNSAIPAFVARVLLDAGNNNGKETAAPKTTVRLLKDYFMAKGKEEKHCGWHVDDVGFWPTDSSSSGVNVWLSLDNIQSKYGGGLAISPGSHLAEWRQQAYEALGSIPILPPEGLTPDNLKNNTCEMEAHDAELNKHIESTKLEFDYQPGDCLFCHRWLFHRSVPLNEDGLKHYKNDDGLALKRYTIRYERGTAKLLKGICLEPAILMNPKNSGKSLDEVCACDVPYYPQCWPLLEEGAVEKQSSGMELLAREVLPVAQVKRLEAVKNLLAKNEEKKESS